jgi:phage shock protein PspC (stress-responsive transcriptional regulator)
MALFCNRCGTALPHSARFCSNCGTTVMSAPVLQARPLYRPIAGRMLAGVCIALAQTYGWDVALVRIFTVVVFFFSGGVVAIAYLACWIGIPEEPMPMPMPPPAPTAYPPNV